MPIQWREEMSVGNDIIDDDHKNLIGLINEYEAALSMKNPVILKHAITGLVDYANSHFEREEKLMAAVHYPHLNAHREHHRTLLYRIEDFHEGILKAHKIDLGEASRFLYDWLVRHVLDEDLKLRPYVAGERHDIV